MLIFFHVRIDICEPLPPVTDGVIDCDYGDNGGPNSGDTCILTCNDGLVVNGSDVRTCMDDGIWSGDDGECVVSKLY